MAALAAAFGLTVPTLAQTAARPVCMEYTKFLTAYGVKYGEAAMARGLVDGGKTVLEVWASADGKTWTVVTININGIACIIGTGKSWETIPFARPSSLISN